MNNPQIKENIKEDNIIIDTNIKDINRQIVKKLYRNKSDLNRLSSKDKLNDKFERNKSYLNLSKNIINYSYFN